MTQNIFRIGDTVRISDIGLQKIANISKREEMSTITGKILNVRTTSKADLPTASPHRERQFIYYVEWSREFTKKRHNNANWQSENRLAKVLPS